MSRLIRISDIINDKIRKERELEFYEQELEKLNKKMANLRYEINVTNIIIDLVKRDDVRDFKKDLEDKQ